MDFGLPPCFFIGLRESEHVLTFQVRREMFLELETCVAEVGFDRAFAASGACGDVFNGEFCDVE